MALPYRTLYINRSYLKNLSIPVKWCIDRNCAKVLASGTEVYYKNPVCKPEQSLYCIPIRRSSTKSFPSSENEKKEPQPDDKKLGLIQRFKAMYRDYWYVLLPVHMGTSMFWFGSAYYMVISGVDVISLLQTLGISETIIEPLRDSKAGYFALALALYKLVTPLRYAVTVGLTTFAIKRLVVIGWIKPVPSRERLRELYHEKKDNLQDRFNESKLHYQAQMKEKSTQMMEEVKRYKTEIRDKRMKKM